MRRILLIFALFCASYLTVNAQTNTWTGAGANTNWNTIANWSLNLVPTAAHDVVIPTGFTVNLNVAGTTKSIAIQGNSVFNMSNNLSILNASSIATNVTVNWTSSSLIGGGTLTNNGSIILNSGSSRYITDGTTLTNNGTVTMPQGGYLYLYDTSVFNNTASGVFDFQSNANFSYSGSVHNFTNAGLIKKSAGDAIAYLSCRLNNTGTITVEAGNLTMNTQVKTFNGGVYNVSPGATLVLSSVVNVNDVLTGVLNGNLNWTGDISVATAATFNFTGTAQVNWNSGSLIGGGALTNGNTIRMASGSSRYIEGGTTLINNGTVTMPQGGYLYLYDTSVFNNTASAVFDFQSDATISYSGSVNNFINAGLIKKTAGDAISYLSCRFNNTGTISVEAGTLTLNTQAKTFNGGVYNVSSGAILVLSSLVNVTGALTGVLNGPLRWTDDMSVASAASFNFTGTAPVNWNSGSLIGGGTLTNANTISMASAGSRYIEGGSTLINNGTVTMPQGGYLYLYDASIFNNTAAAVFDFQSDATVSYSGSVHNFVNTGLIKKTAGDAISYLSCRLNNTGTISVESGTLTMNTLVKTFNGGVYNVSTGKSLVLSADVNVTGGLSGVLNGAMNFSGDINVATTAALNFTGATGVTWTAGSLLGGGILTNNSTMSLASSGTRYISGANTKLINTGSIIFPLAGYLVLSNNATIDNLATGVIDFQSDAILSNSGGGAFSISNLGLIQKTAGTGISYIYPPVTNSGVINVSSGELEFQDGFNLVNTVNGVIKGTATIDLPTAANFTNNGTFAPGGDPGVLTVLGTYKSSPTSVLDVQLNGLTQGTQYDVLSITGTGAIFDGSVNVTLGFAANVNDEFIIATTTGPISQCNLATPTSADFNGMTYTFNVACRNDNQVVISISNIALGVDEFELTASSIQVYPNPVHNTLTIKNVNNIELVNGEIMDITGKTISTFDLREIGMTKDISMQAYANGMYFIKINGLNNSITKRVVKQ